MTSQFRSRVRTTAGRTLLVGSFFALVFSCIGCRTNEDRIRAIVREELAAAMRRSAVLDAYTVGPYSPAQRVGNFLFVSGQIALDQESGVLVNSDVEAEARQALENLLSVLRKAGYDSSDVVSTTLYLTSMGDYGKVNSIYGGYFQDGNYPARATVQVAALPRGARVEISAIAYKPY